MRVVDFTAGINFRDVDALLATGDLEESVDLAVREIIDDVRRRGDTAV